MAGEVAPFIDIGKGEQAHSGTQPATASAAESAEVIKHSKTVFQQASKEDIQDYVAELFTHNEHVNFECVYDDDQNILQLTVTGSGTIQTPDDIADAVAALDGAIQ